MSETRKYRFRVTPHARDSHGHIEYRRKMTIEVEARSQESAAIVAMEIMDTWALNIRPEDMEEVKRKINQE